MVNDVEDFRVKIRAELIAKGYTIWIRRQGKCSVCGMWLSHAARHHRGFTLGPTVGPTGGGPCDGGPRGRRRYSAWVNIPGRSPWYPAGLFPEIARTVTVIEGRAKEAREDRVFEVAPSR